MATSVIGILSSPDGDYRTDRPSPWQKPPWSSEGSARIIRERALGEADHGFYVQEDHPTSHALPGSVPGLRYNDSGDGRGDISRSDPRRQGGRTQVEDIPEKAGPSGGGLREGTLPPADRKSVV